MGNKKGLPFGRLFMEAQHLRSSSHISFTLFTQDARHFDKYVLKALQDHADELKALFNQTE